MVETDYKQKFLKVLNVNGKNYHYYSLNDLAKFYNKDLTKLPYSLRVLLENLLRNFDGNTVKEQDIEAFWKWLDNKKVDHEIEFRPARVLMQDFTGVPAVVDLAAMREAITKLSGDAQKINPLSPVDLVIDHSVQVDKYGTGSSLSENSKLEMERNIERYEFLRWGQGAFNNFRVVPPGTGICHQVNLEFLAKVVWTKEENGQVFAFPDTVVGTDSHTTMINGLSVLGWGVGGIEAEAVMLGQPMSMLIPEVVGFKLTGKIKEGTTATDVVLTITQLLRAKGVVNKFVEFFGSGLSSLTLADRATIANMAPEYGATCGFFPVDQETLNYLNLSSRPQDVIELTESYAKAQGLWNASSGDEVTYTDILELDLGTVEPSLAGPRRPQDRVQLSKASQNFKDELPKFNTSKPNSDKYAIVEGADYKLGHGDIVIASITSCTNTSNPSVMIAAGLVAKKAAEKGLKAKPWVKTSLAPGSKVVSEYLENSGLQKHLDFVGYNIVGYGCTTCIGNSGPLNANIEKSIADNDVVVAAILSGNRNFEGRVHPLTRANYLASPPLVVAYSIAGSMNIDLAKDSLGKDASGNDVFLADIWPSIDEVNQVMKEFVTRDTFGRKYADVFLGEKEWQDIKVAQGKLYNWNTNSTYIANPPYFEGMSKNIGTISNIKGAKLLAIFGDSITTDHISPAGNISKSSPAAKFLLGKNVQVADFNSYGARRGHHEVMMRGTFANIRIKNELAPGTEGGVTTYLPNGEVMSIYDAAMKYKEASTPLIILAGKEYGTGSSRDWAAKGTMLLGVKAVIAESFERIHRSNLVRMGVIPFDFGNGLTRKSLNLKGNETFEIEGLEGEIKPKMKLVCKVTYEDGKTGNFDLVCRLDTNIEIEYVKHGGILPFVIRQLLN